MLAARSSCSLWSSCCYSVSYRGDSSNLRLEAVMSTLNARWLRATLGLVLLAAVACVPLGASPAGADVPYNLTGTWDTYGTGNAYTGTFTITTMDLTTGAFSGTGDGSTFILKGTEFDSTVQFTQSEGTYLATDSATLDLNNGKLVMVNGNWSDTNGSGGTFTASKAYTGTISGTVTRGGKPLAGVTLTASNNAGNGPRAVSTSAGTYQINLTATGTWTVTPSGLGLKYQPADHIVFVTGDSTGVDFSAGGGASLQRDKVIAKSGGIDLWYRGQDWDPTGSTISLSFGGQTVGSEPAASAIADKVTVPYWPLRHTINNDKDPAGKACWGNLNATQGSSVASAEFDARGVGVVIWSLDPHIGTGQVYCSGEPNSALFSGGDIIALNFTGLIDVYDGPGKVIRGIPVSQLQGGHHLCYAAPSQNVYVILTISNGVIHGTQGAGLCPST